MAVARVPGGAARLGQTVMPVGTGRMSTGSRRGGHTGWRECCGRQGRNRAPGGCPWGDLRGPVGCAVAGAPPWGVALGTQPPPGTSGGSWMDGPSGSIGVPQSDGPALEAARVPANQRGAGQGPGGVPGGGTSLTWSMVRPVGSRLVLSTVRDSDLLPVRSQRRRAWMAALRMRISVVSSGRRRHLVSRRASILRL